MIHSNFGFYLSMFFFFTKSSDKSSIFNPINVGMQVFTCFQGSALQGWLIGWRPWMEQRPRPCDGLPKTEEVVNSLQLRELSIGRPRGPGWVD